MHNLIPKFIYEQYKNGNSQGQLKGITLFLDIAGFTPMTQALTAHDKEGAEILANIINRVFNPIIHLIYQCAYFSCQRDCFDNRTQRAACW